MRMDAGILPVKGLGRAKTRLAQHLGEAERGEVVAALLADAFALCESATFLSWWVVSDDENVLSEAAAREFATVADPGAGLNPALSAALDAVSQAGASSATVVPCDVPLAWAGDLQDLLDTGTTSDVVVVPSRDGGTNGLFLGPPDVMPPLFGTGSLRAHIEEAERRSIRCSILSLPRLELDIDTIEDVDAYLAKPKHATSRTNEVLVRLRKSARA
jgi:2-phospho-L-lactate/phosphoenolpyruvate guanylyltransferase